MEQRVVSKRVSASLQPTRPQVCGLDVAKTIKNPIAAALVASDLFKGRKAVRHFTATQSLAMTGAGIYDFWLACKLTPDERAALEGDKKLPTSIAAWRRRHQRKAANGNQ
jgi:hypothetical protein